METVSQVYVLVHPFSNRVSQLMALRKENYDHFPITERSYLELITQFIISVNQPLIITQAGWCLKDLEEKLQRLRRSDSHLLTILSTEGSVEGDYPEPLDGWEVFQKKICSYQVEKVIVGGSQLEGRFPFQYCCCVGETYKNLKRRLSPKVHLDTKISLRYV